VDIRISDFLLSSASGSTAQYDIRITQYGSIKIERLCKTKPICWILKRTLAPLKQRIMKMNDFAGAVKNKPNQTQPVVSLSNLMVSQPNHLGFALLLTPYLTFFVVPF
jgi:hypothetical protein